MLTFLWMTTNRVAAMLFARNWPDADLIVIGNQLLELCDNHQPPFVVVFRADVEAGFPGSSMYRDGTRINLATEDEGGRRRPEDILISLAHEVSHLFDPPTSDDQRLGRGTPEYHARQLEREELRGIGHLRSFVKHRPGPTWRPRSSSPERERSTDIVHFSSGDPFEVTIGGVTVKRTEAKIRGLVDFIA